MKALTSRWHYGKGRIHSMRTVNVCTKLNGILSDTHIPAVIVKMAAVQEYKFDLTRPVHLIWRCQTATSFLTWRGSPVVGVLTVMVTLSLQWTTFVEVRDPNFYKEAIRMLSIRKCMYTVLLLEILTWAAKCDNPQLKTENFLFEKCLLRTLWRTFSVIQVMVNRSAPL